MKIGNLPILPPEASTSAGAVDFAALIVLGICLVLGLGVLTVMLVFLVRYRAGSRVDRTNPPLSKPWLEWTWIAIPTLLGVGMFWAGASAYLKIYQMPEHPSIVIDVVGKQWMWEVYYPNGRKEINNLHIPLGQTVELRMISEDVIHSFFVPDFRVKHDVLPGRYTYLWFEATRTGHFHLFCSEFCGTSHAVMAGFVDVMSQQDYQAWLNDVPREVPQGESTLIATPAERGKRLFNQIGCNSCHGGIQVPAPRLQGLYGKPVTLADNTTVTADDDYIRESILYPQKKIVSGFGPIMPTYNHRLKESQILDLIAYIRSLGGSR
jgi:cytochrome c oxidase subunit 2